MSRTKRQDRQALTDQLLAIDENIKFNLSRTQRIDTHGEAHLLYATIQDLATMAQDVVRKLEIIDTVPVQEVLI